MGGWVGGWVGGWGKGWGSAARGRGITHEPPQAVAATTPTGGGADGWRPYTKVLLLLLHADWARSICSVVGLRVYSPAPLGGGPPAFPEVRVFRDCALSSSSTCSSVGRSRCMLWWGERRW